MQYTFLKSLLSVTQTKLKMKFYSVTENSYLITVLLINLKNKVSVHLLVWFLP